MIHTQGLTHIHLMVQDLERSLTFYKHVFGLEERFREGRHMVFLNTPGSQDLITLNEAPASTPPSPRSRRPEERSSNAANMRQGHPSRT